MSRHTLTIRAVDSIPPRGARKRPETVPEATYKPDAGGVYRRVRNTGYDAPLVAFLSGEYGPHALVVSRKTLHPDTLYRGLLSARRELDAAARVDVLQRGDRVYLTQPTATAAERAARRDDIQDTLIAFDSSEQRIEHVDADGGDVGSLYHALQYKRTRLGLGHIRIERTPDGARLVNTMVEGKE